MTVLIRIDSSGIEDAAGDGPTCARSREAIEHLLRAHHAGKHVVSVDAAAKNALRGKLSDLARATLDSIIASRAQLEGLRKDLRIHLVVGVGPLFEQLDLDKGGWTILRASLHHFEDFEHAARSVLLGEHQTDADLFACIGRAWLSKMAWRQALSHELRIGGGNSTAEAFEEAAKSGRILLALADSDVTYPDGPRGETWNKLQKAARSKPAFQRARALPVRAAENLIPHALYDEALKQHERDTSTMHRLEELAANTAMPAAWREHADLKNGTKLAAIEAIGDPAGQQFWQQIMRITGRATCEQKVRCQRSSDCKCFVIDGLGVEVLKHVVQWMKSQPPKHVANLLELGTDSHADWVAEQVVAWGIAPQKRAT